MYLILKEAREADEEHLKDAGLEQRDLIVVVEALKAGHELGEGADLAHVIHEPLGKVFQKRILRSPLHGTSLQKKRIQHEI